MKESQFRYQASVLHLPRQMRHDIVRNKLYIYLKPGFTEKQCTDLIRMNRKGLRPVEPPGPGPAPTPHIVIPPGHTGPVYIFLGQPGQPEEVEEEKESGGPNWVLPLAIILLIIGIAVVLVAINPALIPPAILALFGG